MNTLHVNVGLARYSDWAFTSAVVALVVALLLLAFEFAQVRGRGLAPLAVPAGSVATDSATPGIVPTPPAALLGLVERLPWLSAVPAYFVGVGVRPEHAPAFARRGPGNRKGP